MSVNRSTGRLSTAVVGATLLLGCVSGPAASQPAASQPAASQPDGLQPVDGTRVLVFSKTAGFRHDSIPDGVAAIRQLGESGGFTVDATEDAGAFTARNLRRYDAVVFLSTTGDVLGPAQQRAFEDRDIRIKELPAKSPALPALPARTASQGD